MEDIILYSQGLVYASVCAINTKTVKEITDWLNTTYPTGVDSKWKLANENFADGTPNPTVCNIDVNRKHYLFTC